jgi:hypothetical protein
LAGFDLATFRVIWLNQLNQPNTPSASDGNHGQHGQAKSSRNFLRRGVFRRVKAIGENCDMQIVVWDMVCWLTESPTTAADCRIPNFHILLFDGDDLAVRRCASVSAQTFLGGILGGKLASYTMITLTVCLEVPVPSIKWKRRKCFTRRRSQVRVLSRPPFSLKSLGM